ncbi:MAG: leucyl aminopeptidase family protein [Chitinispirillaceae bacterium]
MKIQLSKSPKFTTRVEFFFEEADNLPTDFRGKSEEVTVRYGEDTTVICCGIGRMEECSERILRSAGARGIQKAIELKRSTLSMILPQSEDLGVKEMLCCVEGAILGGYKFVKYKREKPAQVEKLEVIGPDVTSKDISRTEKVAQAVNFTRDLVNENACEVTPERLAREAQALGRKSGMKVTVLDEKEIDKQGLDLIKAVGKGSCHPPRLITMEYTGKSSSKERHAVVGKGVTFDAGGLNLKPSGSIETMREDMAGAAAVLGFMKCIGELKPKVNIIGVIPTAFNGIGPDAYFPGDVLKSYSGLTVEINNTDAEGRLLLGDAISYCKKKYKPGTIIDLATLTGGISISFANIVAGLFSNDDELAESLFEAGENSGERLWRMPLYKEYSDSIKGDISDIRNLSKFKRGHGGSIVGAAFIKEFVEDTPWAHLDIAGTAWNEGSAKAETPQYATGFGVRLLVEHFLGEK